MNQQATISHNPQSYLKMAVFGHISDMPGETATAPEAFAVLRGAVGGFQPARESYRELLA